MDSTEMMSSLPTLRVLRSFGFVEGRNEIGMPALVLNMSRHAIYATEGVDRFLRSIIHLGGIISDGRSGAMLDCNLPTDIDSRELALAWLSWALRDVDMTVLPQWLQEGRAYWSLLPWEKQRAEYENRPCCSAERDWVRVALKTLGKHLEGLLDDQDIVFSFDGKILRIECMKEVIAFPATGKAWPCVFISRTNRIRGSLPTRLRQEITFLVSDGNISIGSRRYPGVMKDYTAKEHEEKI